MTTVDVDQLVAGTEYWAEMQDCCIDGQVWLGKFLYQSGEGFLYFANGSFCSWYQMSFHDVGPAQQAQ